MRIPSGSTDRYLFFVAVDENDLETRETGLTDFTVYYCLDDGSAAAMTTPTTVEVDSTNMPGVYKLLIDESAMTTLAAGHNTEELVLHITKTGMSPVTRVVEICRPDEVIELAAKTIVNKAVQNKSTGVIDYYDDDGETVILTHTPVDGESTIERTPA